MKLLLAPLAITLLSISGAACGNTGVHARGSSGTKAAQTTSTTSPSGSTKADADKDNDIGAPYDDKNNSSFLDFGYAASEADKHAIVNLVKRYYAAAAASDGAAACPMILSSLEESVAEDYGRGSAGPPYLKSGTTCPSVMMLLFNHYHSQLVSEVPQLNVTQVRLSGHRGFAILSFGSTMPEREIAVGLERHRWTIQALLDKELP